MVKKYCQECANGLWVKCPFCYKESIFCSEAGECIDPDSEACEEEFTPRE